MIIIKNLTFHDELRCNFVTSCYRKFKITLNTDIDKKFN